MSFFYRTSGWSNFCSLVGRFSKLFEFAGLSRLKTPIFVPKLIAFSKKKKGLHLKSISEILIFVLKVRAFPPSKKSLHLESVSTLDSLPSARHALLCKVVAACDRQDLCKIVPRARSWTTLPSSFEEYPLQVRNKQYWGRGFILLLPQTAVLPGSDAGSDVIKPASSFVIQNRQTSYSMWCPMYRARC